MQVTKQPNYYPSKSVLRLALPLLLTLAFSGCGTTQPHQPPEKNKTTQQAELPKKTSRKQSTKDIATPKAGDKSKPLCAYESIKGIAEVTSTSKQAITFKFYPGDQYFNVNRINVPLDNIKIGQELKAIAKTLISGPCEATEFELLTPVD